MARDTPSTVSASHCRYAIRRLRSARSGSCAEESASFLLSRIKARKQAGGSTMGHQSAGEITARIDPDDRRSDDNTRDISGKPGSNISLSLDEK